MSMVNLTYSARVISSDTGWRVFTTAGTTGIHYCWLCLWCPVLLSTAGLHCCAEGMWIILDLHWLARCVAAQELKTV